MKLGEKDPSARRVGPIKAIDAVGNPVVDFSNPGDVQIKVNGGAFVDVDGSRIVAIGGTTGYVYYQATEADASVQGFFEIKLAGTAQEVTIREEVELSPQGIPAGTTIVDLLVAGSLRLVDGAGAALNSLVGVVVEVTVNGSAWAAAAGTLSLVVAGYADYAIAGSESGARGWVAVKATGACQEVVFRVDIVAPVAGPKPPLTRAILSSSTAGIRIAGDIALQWIEAEGRADLIKILDAAGLVVDLATDRGLITALLLSLFLDRRAEDDDVPPSGDATDRRGWWGDQFLEVAGDRYGSRLWLLARAKLTNETALQAEEYVREALAWMIEDKVVSSIDFESETKANALWFAVKLNRPGRDAVSFRFAHVWDHLEVT